MQISRWPHESRSSSPDLLHNGLHIRYDSCQMFNGWNPRKAKRHNNGFHIAHDSCDLFIGPTIKKQKDIILDLTMHTDGTIGVDLLTHTALKCNVIMSLCFSKVLALDKSKNCNVNLAARYLRHQKNAPTRRALKHRQGHSQHASAEYFLRVLCSTVKANHITTNGNAKAMSMVPLEQLANPK
jgi:hypothetical protein